MAIIHISFFSPIHLKRSIYVERVVVTEGIFNTPIAALRKDTAAVLPVKDFWISFRWFFKMNGKVLDIDWHCLTVYGAKVRQSVHLLLRKKATLKKQ